MADHHDPAELKDRLFHEIRKRRTGMLGLTGAEHMQPMTAFCEEHGGPIWFYCRRENDLVLQAGQAGRPSMFCVVAGDDSFIACVGGTLREDYDRERIAQYWNPVVAAWFPEGKDDAALTLLRLDPVDAMVWLGNSNPLRFGFEIAKANITHTLPDAGETAHLDL